MTDREKLRELIGNVQDEGVSYVDCFSDTDKPEYISNDELARYLISRGVRLESKTSDKTSDSKWISVEERLPEVATEVLFVANKDCVYLGAINKLSRMWQCDWCSFDRDEVAHWMPLPQPPREE